MEQSQCIFCSIIKKLAKAFIVYEDEHSVGFLDIMPRSKGMVIVVPKQHFTDFEENVELAAKVFLSAEKVASKLKTVFKPLTIYFSVMPSQVPHFNVKVYPVYEKEVPLMENQPKKMEETELASIAQAIKSASEETGEEHEKQEEIPKEEEKPKEQDVKKKSRSKEEEYWIRRGLEIA